MPETITRQMTIAEVAAVEGRLDLVIDERPDDPSADAALAQEFRLSLTAGGWSLAIAGKQVANGQGPVAGHAWSLANLDGQVVVERDAEPLSGCPPVPVAFRDPQTCPTRISLDGSGQARLTGLTIERDVHYCANGFLADERATWSALCNRQYRVEAFELRHNRQQILACLVDADLRQRLLEDLGQTDDSGAGSLAWLRPVGTSPATALQAPDDGYLMLGDNSPLSWDGRNWGWTPELNLRGQVLCVVLPFNRIKVVR